MALSPLPTTMSEPSPFHSMSQRPNKTMMLPFQPVQVFSPSLPIQTPFLYKLLSMISQSKAEFSDSKAVQSQPVAMSFQQLIMFSSQPVHASFPSPTTMFEPSHFLAISQLPDKTVTHPFPPV
jgi:hypothetical protein